MHDAFDISYYESPIGLIQIKSVNQKISSVLFQEKETDAFTKTSSLNAECIQQLKQYFTGELQQFNLPLYQIGTEFQQKVWDEVYKIPYGSTVNYAHIARQLGDQKSVRAVGTSNGKNQIAIIIPCHRVIGADGNLTGYAWELWRKEWLLKHEINYAGVIEGRLF